MRRQYENNRMKKEYEEGIIVREIRGEESGK